MSSHPPRLLKGMAGCFRRAVFVVAATGSLGVSVFAADPPHYGTNNSISCGSCHVMHLAAGAALTTVAGNANACMSCHISGGSASSKAFVAADQALPWPGLPAGTNTAGTSHRWDANAAGHLLFLGGAVTPSTGTITPSGVYTGYYAKTYTIQITSSGAVGTAQFSWSATLPGGGAGTGFTGTNVLLDSGVFLAFADGTNTSFQAGDRWNLFVRTDLRNTTNTNLLLSMVNGVATCSACHNQHSEAKQPFDPNAQPYTTNLAGTFIGTNRHFMRIANDSHQLCNDCHAPRAVTDAVAGSHPVEIFFAADAYHKAPTQLPLELLSTNLGCLTCHQIHRSPDADGKLLRLTNSVSLCADCHTLANTASAHFSVTNSATLWPGGKNGSLMPARTDLGDRGTCVNCHAVHGWPDAANPTNHYPHLLADYQENFCFTCHGTTGPAAKKVQADFAGTYHHPVADNDPQRRAGRAVECVDCHNPHKAQPGSHVYTATATALRNTITNTPALIGVDGVAVNYAGMTNYQVVATNRYSYIPDTTGASYEYQVCFKCHTGYSFPGYNTGTATFTSGSATVTGSGTSWTTNLIGMWIANTNDTRTYVITAVASATSLTISPASTITASGQGFLIRNIPAGQTPYYTAGTATFTPGSASVTGTGTSWSSSMIGSWICSSNNPSAVYIITAVPSATSLTNFPAYK